MLHQNYVALEKGILHIKNWQKCLDTSAVVGAVLMNPSKAYDWFPHDILITRLAAYGFDKRG